MTEPIARLLLRLSEAGAPAHLWGRQAAPYMGADFERLLERGVLVEQPRATTWSPCIDCECDLDERSIEQIEGQFVAVCPLDHRRDVALSDHDLRTFLIDPDALVLLLARDAGLCGDPSLLDEGLWHLGTSASGAAVFIDLLSKAEIPLAQMSLMKQVANRRPIVLLLPHATGLQSARLSEAGISVRPIADVFASPGGWLALADESGVANSDDVSGVRLAIYRKEKRVLLDGVSMHLPAQPFQLLLLLAEHALEAATILENRKIEDALWGSSIHTISSEVREPIRVLRNALAKGAEDPSQAQALIENRRNPNGYRLCLRPDEIRIFA